MNGRLALLTTVAISAALAGRTSGPSPRPIVNTMIPVQNAPTPIPTPTPAAVGDGTVTGGLYRCSALAPAVAGPATRVAGTVDVFRGPLPGLPDEIIKTNGTYDLQLSPGEYDLVGHWTGSNLAPPIVKVVVSSGTTIRQDLVYRGRK